MKRRALPLLALALAVALAFLAYADPLNVWRWSSLMTLCQ